MFLFEIIYITAFKNISVSCICCISVFENVVIGPTAEEVDLRLPNPTIDDVISERLKCHGRKTVPSLSNFDIVNMYTGVRPATKYKDYQIIANAERYVLV